jgi:ADP-heptose:LPS heptosyltransferase
MFSELHNKSGKLLVECDKRLIPLYERSFPEQIKFVSDRNEISNSDYDSQIPIGSLPKYLRHTLEDFTLVSHGWLKADMAKRNFLHAKLKVNPSKKIIGISWHTSTSQADARHRNIPLELLAHCLKQIPATFISLQYGDTDDELIHVRNATGLDILDLTEIDKFNDIDGLAALIAVCDTVVSIDNATVHLAGALGVDTKVLLPLSPDERWSLNDNKSYWYDHLTLYRQEQLANWTLPLNRLVKDLGIYRV